MRPELPLIVLVALLLVDGCGRRDANTEASIPHAEDPLPKRRGLPESPSPAYDLPLDIHIEAPSPPDEIQGPSPPIAPDSPRPQGVIDKFLKGLPK